MNKGNQYKHKHILHLTCTVEELTNKGAKVKQTDGQTGRTKTAYYNYLDFSQTDQRNLWILTGEVKKTETDHYHAAQEKQTTIENQLTIF